MTTLMHSSTTLTADGNGLNYRSTGRLMAVTAQGTWGGGTVELKVSADNGTTFVSLKTPLTLTDNGSFTVTLPRGVNYRIELSGSTNPSLKVYQTKEDDNY